MKKVYSVVVQYGKNKRTMDYFWVLEEDLDRFKEEQREKYQKMGWYKELNFHLIKGIDGEPGKMIDENDIFWYWVVNRYKKEKRS